MARDNFDESKTKKEKTTVKAATKPKSQSSSVSKAKTTTSKVNKTASKSTFLGGGASTQAVKKATTNNKPKTVKTQPTKQERINQKMYGSTTAPERRTKTTTSNTQRTANRDANLNLKQTVAQTSRTRTAAAESQRRAAQQQKMTAGVDAAKAKAQTREIGKEIRRSVTDSLSAENRAFAQRQKSGTLTEADKKKVEQRDQRRAQIVKNTGAVAKKAIKDTGSGYAQSLYDITELTASNKNGTQAKAMKMGIDPNKDTRQMSSLERQQKYTAEESKRRRDELFKKQEQRQAEWDERTKNAKGLEKAWYGAVESGTGMVADTLVGAATGTGQFGALASMGLRTYGSSANQARKEGATDKEARLYGLAQSAKEVGTELMFQGAGLAKAAYGKTGLSLADKSANVLTRGLTGLKADAVGAGVRALGGTAEENIEELAGWMADPLIKELTYGKAVRNRMKENLRSNIPQIGSDADAANVASYFSTPKFTDDLTNEYVKSGMSKDKASALAAEMRDYYVAYYSGDKGKMDALEEDLAAKLSGQDKLSYKSWSMDELKDTLASTTLLTLATGIPGAVNTSVKGNQIFDSDEVKAVFGNDAVRKVADAVKNTSNKEMSLKADVMKQRLDSGKDLTGTQKFDLYQGYIEKVNDTAKKARASQGVVENAREEQDLVPTMGVDRAGNVVYAKETQREYDEKYASTAATAEALRRFMESDNSISDDEIRRTDAAIKAVSDLHVGGLTIGDAHEFAYGNELARETLKAEEGIDLNRYIVRDANGNVDLAATNEATENALFEINAANAIKAAQAETEVYIDDTRGNIDKDLLTRFGNSGQAAWKEVNKDLDPRDLKNYLTTANAASYFYSAGRNTDMSVDTAIERYADTFKTVDNSVLEKAFAAGAEDRIIANTPGYGQTVEAGSNIQLKKTEPIITGQLIMDDDVVIPDSDQSAYLALAMSTNSNIHIVGNLNAMGKDGKPIINQATGLPVQLNGMSHGNEIYLNMNASAEQNLGYVFMHEMTHQIKQYAPNEYLALENLVRDKWFNKDATGMQAAIKQRMDLYSTKGGQQLTEEEAVEEIIADAMAEAMDDPNFAAEVCEQDINLGQQILDGIRAALRSIRQMFANSDVKNDRFHNSLLSYLGILDEAEKMWLNALHTARQNKADGLIADWQDKANKQNAPRLSVGEEKYSITTDKEDFIKGANLSKDLRDWAKEMSLDKLSKQPIKGPVIVSVRDLRTAWYEKNGRTDEANVINTALDKIGDSLTQLVGKYQYIDLGDALNAAVTYRTDAEGKPTSVILSCQVKNAEYEVNFDFTTICAKRLAMQKILERFIKTEGERQGTTLYDELKLDEEGLYKLRLILETAGFDVSCRGCFVEQNRYSQQNQARTIANDWNAALDAWAKENGTEVTENFGLTTLDIDSLDYEEIEAGFERYHELMKGKKTDVATKNRMLIEASPFFRKRMNASDYASMTGQRALMAIGESKKGGTNLYGLLKRGQSDSKQSVPFTAYNGEISLLPDNMKGKSLYDYLLSIGGARAQSASDFQIEFVYDYMQMVADLSARGLPMHMYTKVIELAELFGMTGIKINLSAMCDVAEDVGGEYAGLKLVDGKYEYNISDQSIDYPKAVELQKKDGYSKNIGIIMVTLSSQHMLKSLDDPDVRYIIGYHSSAMPVVVANMSNMGGATDYTKINKTNKLNEKGQALFDEAMAEAKGDTEIEKYKDALRIFDEKIQEETAKKKKKPRRGNEYGAYMSAYGNNTADFNTYDSLLETKDARKTADKYLEHCMKNDLIPIYFPFAFHENYYKCEVYDFNMYDNNTGEYAPMEGVQNIYPGLNMAAGETDTTAFTDRVSQMMDAQNRTNKALDSQYDAVFDEAKNTLKYSITGDDYMDFDASGIDHNELTHRADATMTAEQQRDADYMDAVNSGNMDEAQRLVDEAAKMAGYGVRAYHGTPNYGFTEFQDVGAAHGRVFGDGFYFSSERNAVQNFTLQRDPNKESKPGVYNVFLKPADDALEFDWENYTYNGRKVKGAGLRSMIQMDIEAQPDKDVIVHNINDGSQHTSTVYVIKDAGRIKSSDPVTYAEDGSVIPLSERFDPTNNDIRYSLPTQDSDGNILTDGQMEYFKNSQARDIFGRLVPVYHATDMGGFTIFDPWKSDDHRSLFFSNRRDAANTYVEDKYLTDEDRLGSDENNGGQTGYYQVYLNLENPLIIDGQGQPWNDIVDGGSVFPAYSYVRVRDASWYRDDAENSDEMYAIGQRLRNGDDSRAKAEELSNSGLVEIEIFDGEKKHSSMISSDAESIGMEIANIFGIDDFEIVSGLAENISLDMDISNSTRFDATDMRNTIGEYGYNTREWAEFAADEGYDGVIFRNIIDIDDKTEMFDSEEEAASDIYVAFSSNQVKDTRNENPTENPDIRYSIVDEDEAMSHMAHDYAYDTSYEALAYYEDLIAADASTETTYEKAKNYIAKDVDEFYAGLTRYADGMKFDDPVLEEGRTRMAKSKQDYFNSNVAKWNQNWLTDGEVLDIKSVRKAVKELVMANMQDSDTDRKYRTELVNKMLIDIRLAYFYAKKGRTDVADALLWHSAFRMVDGVGFYDDDGNYETYKKLRDYFKDARLQLGEEYWSDVDYAAFRKRNYGKLNLVKGETNIDKIFGNLYEEKEDGSLGGIAPEYFTPEAFEQNDHKFGSVPDTLLQIEDVLLDLEPYAKAYSSEYCAEWATDIAADLLNIMQNGKELQSIADRYTNKYEARIKAMKARHAEAMLKVRQQRDEGIKREKAKFKEYKEQQKEKRAHNKSFESIQKTHKKLTERLLTNTADKNIPEQYKRDLARLLAAFDLQTVGSKKYEMRTGRQGQKTIKMAALKTALTNIENKSHEFHVSDAITDIIDELLGKNAGAGYSRSIEGLTIDELNSSELDRIDKLLKALLHEFNTYRNVKIGAKRQQTEDIGKAQVDSALEHAKIFGAGKDYQNIPGGIDRIINLDEVTPAYMFKHIDPEKSGLGLMFKELRRSFDKYVKNQEQLNEWMNDIVGKYHKQSKLPWRKYGAGELENWRSENYSRTFNLESGDAVTLTPAQMMSLYCLSKRTQAYNHMTGAGIVVAPVSFNAKILSDIKKKANTALPKKLTDADIKQIVTQLTPDQIKVAEDLQQLMAERMAAWGNEASMNVLGIELFGEPDYFPIKSDKAALEKDLNENEFVEAIRNFGFTKAVQPGARNAIMVDDIFDVVTEHCNNMNLYNAYSEAINDFMKVYNYRDFRDDGSEYTVQQAIAHAYGSKATTFIMTFMRDLNGNVSGRASGIENLYNSLLGNAKKAAVFANLRVAAQQPTAITRAFAVIDPKYLKGIKIENGAMDELFEHCPIALWKSWGYYDINMGKSIEDIMMNNGRWLEDAATELYGALDNVTWTAIWQMVKAEMKDTHPDVKPGTDEYWELCNERMTEVVDLTQVVDSPFHRSHAMRDKGIFVKAATSFMAEPTLTFNMIRDGVIRSREAWQKGDKAEAAKIAAKIGAVALLQAATVAGAASLVDALRHKRPDKDDEDERFLHLWWVNALENFHDELKVWNKIYFIKDLASIFEGWDNSNLALQGIQKFALGYRQLTEDPYARSSATWYENMADGIGYMTGVPVKTVRTGLKNAMGMLGVSVSALDSVGEKLDSVSLKKDEGETGMIGKLLGLVLSDEGDTLLDKYAEKKGYKKIEKGNEDTGSEKTSEGGETEEPEKREQLDYDTMLNKALKAAEGYEGEEYNQRIYSSVAQGMKGYIADGDYVSIGMMRTVIERAGGDVNYFDQRVMEETKSAYKKSLKYDMSYEERWDQKAMYRYMMQHGMSQEELSSEILYKSDLAKDMKVAYRIGDNDIIYEAMVPLVDAGMTQTDLDRLYENRNRMDLTKYKQNGRFKDKLKSMGTFIWPTDGVITSHFGYRNAPTAGASSNHPAIDIGAPQGTTVVAADGGVIIYAGTNSGYGNSVGIKHDNGMVTYYNHLYSYNVNVGDTVAQGQQIAKVGSTGISTGPHLDFKILDKNGKPVDPEKYLSK